jgi:hypothetical protein
LGVKSLGLLLVFRPQSSMLPSSDKRALGCPSSKIADSISVLLVDLLAPDDGTAVALSVGPVVACWLLISDWLHV